MSVAWSSSSSSSSSRCPPRLPAQLRLRDPQCSVSDLHHDHPRPVFPAGPQPRPSTPSVPCRTSTTTIHAQYSLPDLNRDHPRPIFPAGPQPRVSMPSVPCRISCRKIWDKEYAERNYILRVIPTITFIYVLTGTSSGILSDIFSDILFGISIWHIFWHIYWHSIW